MNAVRSRFVDGTGAYKWDKIVALAGAVVGSVVLAVVVKKIFR